MEKNYLVASDIHGQYHSFNEILNRLGEDGYRISGDTVLVVNGDFLDRGDQVMMVIANLMKMQSYYGKENIVVLKGNHEELFLDWIDNGFHSHYLPQGHKTLSSMLQYLDYSSDMSPLFYADSQAEAVRHLISSQMANVVDWIRELPLYHDTGDLFITHAGVKGSEDSWSQLPSSVLLWSRMFHKGLGKTKKKVVVGHTPVSCFGKDIQTYQPENSNVVYIDGGAGQGEFLNGVLFKGQDILKTYSSSVRPIEN